MKNALESLNKTLNVCFKAIDNAKIDKVDKVELLINLMQFLDNKAYENNIKILRKEQKKHGR